MPKASKKFPREYGLIVNGDGLKPKADNGDCLIVSTGAPLKAGGLVAVWPHKGDKATILTLLNVPRWLPGEIDLERSEIMPTIEVGTVDGSRENLITLDKIRAIHAVVSVQHPEPNA